MSLYKFLFTIAFIIPALAQACPVSYAKYISNISFYSRDESSGMQKINKEFSDCYLSRKKNPEGGTMWQVAYVRSIAYMSGDKRSLIEAKKIYSEISEKEHSLKTYDKLFDIAIIFRDTEFALELKKKYNIDREIPPKLSKHKNRSILVNKDGVRQWSGFTFPEGGHVVVVANDFCAFSKSFHDFLLSDNDINHSLNKKITWISPIDLQLESGNLINDIYSTSDWLEIDVWETPSIYFYYNGKLVSKIIGWPKDGKRDEFISNLYKIGINIEKPKRYIR